MTSIPPPGKPEPLTSTFGFVCKWCGGERQVIYGTSTAHVCTEYHTALEDFGYVNEQIRIHEGLPDKFETYKQLRAIAEEAVAKHPPRTKEAQDE